MKILILSDTHGKHGQVPKMPEADIFLHAGDFMNSGRDLEEVLRFNWWLPNIPIPKEKRFVSAGNHDCALDSTHPSSSQEKAEFSRSALSNCVYLQEEYVTIGEVKLYMSPWTPHFYGWGFNAMPGIELQTIWNRIPDDTDILVTHGPPFGILDSSYKNGPNLGDKDLLERVNIVKPKLHIFGHIHGSRGVSTNGTTTFVNASFLNEQYQPHKGSGYILLDYSEEGVRVLEI